jgi:RNA polymerase sigma-70 factor, ECF subfamily
MEVLTIYDDALPHVFGYLRSRCRDTQLAEDLTADTFLAAVGQARRGVVDEVTTAWLIGIARHKLIDHWRRQARRPATTGLDVDDGPPDDPWDAFLDHTRVAGVMDRLGPHHRSALTLRYLDGLPVPQVADHLGRTIHATETLLVRARHAFRAIYEGSEP